MILCKEKRGKQLDRSIFPGSQGTPHTHSIAAKAVCLKLAMEPRFVETQKRIIENATCLADELKQKGYRIVFGAVENHTVLLDLRAKGLIGDDAEKTLESVGIMTNKNMVPYDPEKPSKTSGLRLGTSAISTRGMGKKEVRRISTLIDDALMSRHQRNKLSRVREEVIHLCKMFPVYTET